MNEQADLNLRLADMTSCTSYYSLAHLFIFQTQFVAFVIHTGFNILTECDFPKGYSIAVFLYAISLIVLFGNFYYQTYNKKARQKKLE